MFFNGKFTITLKKLKTTDVKMVKMFSDRSGNPTKDLQPASMYVQHSGCDHNPVFILDVLH